MVVTEEKVKEFSTWLVNMMNHKNNEKYHKVLQHVLMRFEKDMEYRDNDIPYDFCPMESTCKNYCPCICDEYCFYQRK